MVKKRRAEEWITVMGPVQTATFGGDTSNRVNQKMYWNRLKDEFDKFICGHSSYKEEQEKLLSSGKLLGPGVVSSLATWIAPAVVNATIDNSSQHWCFYIGKKFQLKHIVQQKLLILNQLSLSETPKPDFDGLQVTKNQGLFLNTLAKRLFVADSSVKIISEIEEIIMKLLTLLGQKFASPPDIAT